MLSLVPAGAAVALVILLLLDLPPTAQKFGSGAFEDTTEGADAETSAGKLAPFYAALAELEDGRATQPATILHLGDSLIAFDAITGELRRLFQARFGDAGRGLMLPGFPFPNYRAPGFSFAKEGAWTVADSVHSEGAYGLTGVSLTSDAAGAALMLTSRSGPFASAELLLLTGPRCGNAIVSAEGFSERVSTLAGTQSALRVKIPVRSSSLAIKVVGNGPVTVLGWSVSSDRPGIRYVNLGIPGASVYTSMRFDPDIAKSDVREMAPKLVLIGYGTNEGFLDYLDLGSHEGQYRRVLGLVSAGAPEASVVILGPPDAARLPPFIKGAARGEAPCRQLGAQEIADYKQLAAGEDASLGRWHEPPSLARMRPVLRSIAGHQGAVYFDLSGFMGGPCSIDRWVKSDPPLALPDHVHLSEEGSNRIARAIYDALMAGYEKFRRDQAAAGTHVAMP